MFRSVLTCSEGAAEYPRILIRMVLLELHDHVGMPALRVSCYMARGLVHVQGFGDKRLFQACVHMVGIPTRCRRPRHSDN